MDVNTSTSARPVSRSVSALSVSSDVSASGSEGGGDVDVNRVAREQEYETRFLGFTPKSFSDGSE